MMKYIFVTLITFVASKSTTTWSPRTTTWSSRTTWSPPSMNVFGYPYTTADRVSDGTYLAISQSIADEAEHLYTFHTGDCSSRDCKAVSSWNQERDCRIASDLIPGATYVQATTTRDPFIPDDIVDDFAEKGLFCDQDNSCSYDIMSKTVTQCDAYTSGCTARSPCLCLCVIAENAGIEMAFSSVIGYVYDSFQDVSAGIAFLAAFGFMSTMYALVRICLYCKGKKEYLPIEQPQN